MYLFLFIFHNNIGDIMKKYLFVFLFLILCNVKASDNLYISKKSYYSDEFVSDCEFLLYDSDNNIVDAWIQSDDIHSISLPVGSYLLFEKPKINDVYSEALGKTYKLDINADKIVNINLSNLEIKTPPNLGIKKKFFFAFILVVFGFVIIVSSRKFNQI